MTNSDNGPVDARTVASQLDATCSSIVRGRWFIVIKKATRQQFYGMLTGSVIIDSAQTDDHHIYDAKVMLFVSNNK